MEIGNNQDGEEERVFSRLDAKQRGDKGGDWRRAIKRKWDSGFHPDPEFGLWSVRKEVLDSNTRPIRYLWSMDAIYSAQAPSSFLPTAEAVRPGNHNIGYDYLHSPLLQNPHRPQHPPNNGFFLFGHTCWLGGLFKQ
ncbi:hypothetical protein FRX31_011930 [Thalictrum thalictroides]|uniref:Uncharacterized protein n=1 Tax=Thalictrum thalictroides TaxID=46969 RepID=A0A7J6WM93_THATH|nr:hypothetical protein FRX31_011930 [Thalictrum thalictroides]